LPFKSFSILSSLIPLFVPFPWMFHNLFIVFKFFFQVVYFCHFFFPSVILPS
jgi:hypothetical protein